MKKKLLFFPLLLLLSVSIKAQVTNPAKSLNKANLAVFNKSEPEYLQLRKELTELEKKKVELLNMMQAFDKKQTTVAARMEKLETKYDSLITLQTGGAKSDTALKATKQMQEIQMLFRMQYLTLQEKMQNENRRYTTVSNVLKTRHDTVKNSISNVR